MNSPFWTGAETAPAMECRRKFRQPRPSVRTCDPTLELQRSFARESNAAAKAAPDRRKFKRLDLSDLQEQVRFNGLRFVAVCMASPGFSPGSGRPDMHAKATVRWGADGGAQDAGADSCPGSPAFPGPGTAVIRASQVRHTHEPSRRRRWRSWDASDVSSGCPARFGVPLRGPLGALQLLRVFCKPASLPGPE